MLLLKSCKKIDSKTLNQQEPDYMSRVRAVVKAQVDKDGGIPQIVYVNQKIKSTFVDMNGNPVSLNTIRNNNLNFASSCADDLPDYADLKYYIRTFNCTNSGSTTGFTVKWQYQFSWDDNIVLVNPYNSANKTKGTLTIKDASGVTQINHTTYGVSIQDLGADPGNPSNEIFAVNFSDDVVIPTYMLSAGGIGAPYTLRLGYTVVSDCASLDKYPIAPEDPNGYGIGTSNADAPCTRNEKAYYLPPGTIATNKIGVSGWNILGNSCGYASPFVQPDLEEVYYNLNGGAWTALSNTTAPNTWGIWHQTYVASNHIAESPILTAGTYTIGIKYRNRKYNSPSYQWQVPTPSNSCNTYDWNYEYYGSQVIP